MTRNRFNPRTHTGCDAISYSCNHKNNVSIHAPTRGATRTIFVYIRLRVFQSTHPHGVRLYNLVYTKGVITVSIHAPTRGATKSTNGYDKAITVSIHAPTRGATDCPLAESVFPEEFQSTHPHGVRPFLSQNGDKSQ